VADGGPNKLKAGSKITKAYLAELDKDKWLEIRLHNEGAAKQLEAISEQIMAQRETFREKYEDEKLASLAERTQQAASAVFNHLETTINPQRLANMTAATLSRFQAELRKTGMAETSIAAHLGHLRSALNWAVKMRLLPDMPVIEMPKQAKGRKLMRGRPITTEEFERMLSVTPKVRPKDAAFWQHYLTGLWLSGLRLEESTVVSWHGDAAFAVDLSGRHPRFRIYAEAHKGRRDQFLPMTPDFASFLLQTPEEERHGLVFKLNGLQTASRSHRSGFVARFRESANGLALWSMPKKRSMARLTIYEGHLAPVGRRE
jgi:site-specific recombinase XerC